MPILYDYRCDGCGHSFDTRQGMMDKALVTCPACGKDALRRILHPPAFAVRQSVTTIGQQADSNLRRMGHYEREERTREHQESSRVAAAATRPQPPRRPWWRKGDKPDLSLARLAPKTVIQGGKIVRSDPLSPEAERYIMTGRK